MRTRGLWAAAALGPIQVVITAGERDRVIAGALSGRLALMLQLAVVSGGAVLGAGRVVVVGRLLRRPALPAGRTLSLPPAVGLLSQVRFVVPIVRVAQCRFVGSRGCRAWRFWLRLGLRRRRLLAGLRRLLLLLLLAE